MGMCDAFIAEMTQEAETTRKVLSRVPADKLAWKPHDKSMSLGQLSLHVAQVPGNVAKMIAQDVTEPPSFGCPQPDTQDEIMAAHDESIAAAKTQLASWDDSAMAAEWTFSIEGKTMMAMPRAAMVRAIMLNHWYHHRGQLTVYLRLLGESVPSVYGPSADENPFG